MQLQFWSGVGVGVAVPIALLFVLTWWKGDGQTRKGLLLILVAFAILVAVFWAGVAVASRMGGG